MKSQISALMDGELDGEEMDATLAGIHESQELRRDWLAYHLIGDFLRSAHPLSHDFVGRFAERLAKEPVVGSVGEVSTGKATHAGDSIGHATGGKIK